jgi:hypothetical protein
MLCQSSGLGVFGRQWRSQDESDLTLAQDVAGLVFHASFKTAIAKDLEAESVAIKIGGLARVADEKANVVDSPQRQGISCHDSTLLVLLVGASFQLAKLARHVAKVPHVVAPFVMITKKKSLCCLLSFFLYAFRRCKME